MAERVEKRELAKQDVKEDTKVVETERDIQQNRIQQLKERKLKQLK